MRAEDLIELGDVYADEADFEEAYHMYLEAALAGSADACFKLALLYFYGSEYLRRDFAKGFHYMKMDFERCGKIRNGITLYELSEENLGNDEWNRCFRDYIEFMIAHKKWHFLIVKGSHMMEGGPYPPDAQAKMQCYEEAWEHGLTIGRELIAEMYYLGKEVPQDYKKAYDLWQSYEGSASFTKDYCIGEMHYYGRYVEQDLKKAAELFAKVVEDGRDLEIEDDYIKMAREKLKEMSASEQNHILVAEKEANQGEEVRAVLLDVSLLS